MSKLSHIEDVERRNQQAQEHEARPAASDSVSDDATAPDPSPSASVSEQGDMSAEQEEEFHGLDTTPPMGAGHKALIVIAVVVVIVAILYIVNSWVHFV